MAKGLRSSSLKTNRRALSKKVFRPVEDARNERMQARLLEIVNQPKVTMDVEKDATATDDTTEAPAEVKANSDSTMEVDDSTATTSTKRSKGNNFVLDRNEKQKRNKAARIQKGGRGARPRNQIVFAKTGKAKARSKR